MLFTQRYFVQSLVEIVTMVLEEDNWGVLWIPSAILALCVQFNVPDVNQADPEWKSEGIWGGQCTCKLGSPCKNHNDACKTIYTRVESKITPWEGFHLECPTCISYIHVTPCDLHIVFL